MLEGSSVDPRHRQPIFPGRTCYPLSADGENNKTQALAKIVLHIGMSLLMLAFSR